MDQLSPAQELVQELVNIVIESSISIDQLYKKYYSQVGEGDNPFSLMRTEYPVIEHEFENEKMNQMIDQLQVNLETFQESSQRRNVFDYYLDQHRDKLKEQHQGFNQSQIVAKAAADFKKLSNLQKISYVRLYLKDNGSSKLISKSKDSQQQADEIYNNYMQYDDGMQWIDPLNITQAPSYLTPAKRGIYPSFQIGNETTKNRRMNMNAIYRPSEQNQVKQGYDSDYRNSRDGLLNQGEISNRRGYDHRGDKDMEYKSKTQGYKGNVKDRNGQNGNADLTKSKVGFQILKSLYKKLSKN